MNAKKMAKRTKKVHHFLAFYSVDNSCGYGRHEFDDIYDDGKAILSKLKKLPEDELWLYDLDWKGQGDSAFGEGSCTGYEELAIDYNDEVLDGGKWVVPFTMEV